MTHPVDAPLFPSSDFSLHRVDVALSCCVPADVRFSKETLTRGLDRDHLLLFARMLLRETRWNFVVITRNTIKLRRYYARHSRFVRLGERHVLELASFYTNVLRGRPYAKLRKHNRHYEPRVTKTPTSYVYLFFRCVHLTLVRVFYLSSRVKSFSLQKNGH